MRDRSHYQIRKTSLGHEGHDKTADISPAAHGIARATGDIDIWVKPTRENAERVMRALTAFGAPLTDLTLDDLTKADTVFQIGVAPSRVDILSGIRASRASALY